MRFLLSITFITALSIIGWSQPNLPKEVADSLWGVWDNENQPDSSRLEAISVYTMAGYLYTQPDSALYFAQLQYDFVKEKGNKKYLSSVLNIIGVIYYFKGDYEKAIDYYNNSLDIEEKIGNKEGIASTLNNIGVIYFIQADYVKAIDCYTNSLKIEEEIGNKEGLPSTLNNIGAIYKFQGDYDRAIDYYTKSLKIEEEFDNKRGISITLGNLGLVYNYKGDQKKAMDFYSKSLKIRKEVGDKKGIATSYNNIGRLHSKRGENTKAMEYFTQSLEIREEVGDKRGAAITLNAIGSIYKSEKNYSKALESSMESLKISKEIGAPKAIKHASISIYLTNILTNNIESSRVHIARILELLNTSVKTNFFTLEEKQKQSYFSTMEADYGLYHDFALNYQDQFENVTDTSYNIALQNKGITLKSSTAMRQSIKESGDTALIQKYEEWLSLKKEVANKNSQDSIYKALTEKANVLERQLVKESNTFSDFDQLMNLQWQDVQAGLNDNEAAIEFVHFTSKIDTANPVIYAALIVKKDSKHPEMVKLCTEADLKEILGTIQGNNLDYVNSVYGNKDKAQKALYEKVWLPMEEYLKDVENVYLSPSGLLHKIAFHAIAKDQNTYLCDVYNLRQQNSTGKVALSDDVAIADNQNFLMLGGVQYSTDATANEIWSYLPGSLDETNNIKSYLQKKKYNITHLTAAEAGEEQFKKEAPNANILHVATHGFFFPDPEKVRAELKVNQEYHEDLAFRGQNINPENMQRSTRYADWTFVKNKNPLMRSGLALANANDVWQRPALVNGEDGVLTANEVSTLNLSKTNLVVLSACETGLGDIKGSEGVYGLQRAFKMAGANYLIMSLWQVPDKETAEFMELFYKNLVKLEDIPKAFNKTQKAMRKKYDPYYWGAFILIE